MAELTTERVRELLDYDGETGHLTRRIALGRREKVGDRAGYLQKSTGYRRIAVDGVVYREHRIAWLHAYGQWPNAHIDHINGDRSDNRIANMRDVARQANNQNRRTAQANNLSSGLLGVTRKGRKWAATIRVNGHLRHIGVFVDANVAHEAYLAAKRSLHVGCTI